MSMQTEIRAVSGGHPQMSSAHRAKEITAVEDEPEIGSYFEWLMSRPKSKKCVPRRSLAIETRPPGRNALAWLSPLPPEVSRDGIS
jgi:hypothetical protein